MDNGVKNGHSCMEGIQEIKTPTGIPTAARFQQERNKNNSQTECGGRSAGNSIPKFPFLDGH
jgi:hypothetical protein